jgi:hypothetical protein
MIDPIPGWSWELRETGIHLAPPAGEGVAGVRYVERARPLRRMGSIVESLASASGLADAQVSAPERVVTLEGEHAAIATVVGTADGRPRTHVVGCVFLDDFHSLVDGVSLRPDHDALIAQKVRHLVVSDRHILGTRRRRYLFCKPTGWQGILVPPFHAYFIARDHHKDAGILSVLPAVPHSPDAIAARLLQGAGAPDDYDLSQGVPVAAAPGLSGSLYTTTSPRLSTLVVVLRDQRYAYPLTLSTLPRLQERHQRVLLEVARSVEPLPVAGAQADPGQAAVLAMWDE